MQSFYAEQFSREMGNTETEWLAWLPAALGDNAWQSSGASVQVSIGAGSLQIDWRQGEPRVLGGGLARIPRLLVRFAFAGLDDAQRYVFMKRFDLYMQRGGG